MGLIDFLFPRFCVGCFRLGENICGECVNKFELCKWQICPKCNKQNRNGFVHVNCRRKFGFDGLTVVFCYRGIMRRLIGKFKNKLVTDVFEDLFNVMVSLGEFEHLTKDKWLVVGAKVDYSKERWRGFNHVEMLAKAISDYFGWEYGEGVLDYNKKSKRNKELNIRGKNVLLVDDVWVGGKKMREDCKQLKKKGVKKVWGVVLAGKI